MNFITQFKILMYQTCCLANPAPHHSTNPDTLATVLSHHHPLLASPDTPVFRPQRLKATQLKFSKNCPEPPLTKIPQPIPTTGQLKLDLTIQISITALPSRSPHKSHPSTSVRLNYPCTSHPTFEKWCHAPVIAVSEAIPAITPYDFKQFFASNFRMEVWF